VVNENQPDDVEATQRLLQVIRGERKSLDGQPEAAAEEIEFVQETVTAEQTTRSASVLNRIRQIFLATQTSTIGLDMGTSTVKYVRFNREGDTFTLADFRVERIYSEDPSEMVPQVKRTQVIEALGRLLDGVPLKSSYVISAVSGPSVIVRQISSPRLGQEQLKESLKFEAKKYIPFELDETEMDFQILDPDADNDTMQVLLVAVTRESMASHLSILAELGVEPVITDVGSLALMNSLYQAEPQALNEAVALLDIGADTSSLNIYRRAGLFFSRDFPISGNRFTADIQKQMQLDFNSAEKMKFGGTADDAAGTNPAANVVETIKPSLDALIAEVRRSFTYYDNETGRKGLNQVFVTGGCIGIPELVDYLSRELGLPVRSLNPFRNVIIPKKEIDMAEFRQRRVQLTQAVGQALRTV
jgi:type IV pilus assembly protein PilM